MKTRSGLRLAAHTQAVVGPQQYRGRRGRQASADRVRIAIVVVVVGGLLYNERRHYAWKRVCSLLTGRRLRRRRVAPTVH